MSAVNSKVREFIKDNFMYTRDDRAELADTESLLDAGLIDFTEILELVAFIGNRIQHPDGGHRHCAGQSGLGGHHRALRRRQARRHCVVSFAEVSPGRPE